jgi:hypothetical protein
MIKRLLSYDPLLGRRQWHIYDPLTRRNHIHTEWSSKTLAQILDVNKAKYNADDKGWSRTKEWRRVASIPFAVLDIWAKPVSEGGKGLNWRDPNHREGILRELNSSEFKYLRTAPGRLSTRG